MKIKDITELFGILPPIFKKALIKYWNEDMEISVKRLAELLEVKKQRIHQIANFDVPEKYLMLNYKKRGYKDLDEYEVEIKEKYEITHSYKDKKALKLFKGIDLPRQIIRWRDDFKCQDCKRNWFSGNKRFPVHHIDCDKDKTNKIDNLDVEYNNLITLCYRCHLIRHSNGGKKILI